MALRRRGGGGSGEGLQAWPGYVDALSTLLMVIIFVLLVFVLAQGFLSVALSGRDRALDRLGRQLAEISDMLSLERGRTAELQLSVAGLNRDLAAASTARDALARQLSDVRQDEAKVAAERDTLAGDRDRLAARLADAEVATRAALSRNETLQGQLADTARRGDAALTQAGASAADAARLQARLTRSEADLAAARRDLAASEVAQAALRETVQTDKATIEARVKDLAALTEQVRSLTALRDELEKQAQSAAARATTEEQRRAAVAVQLAESQRLGDSARAEVALLNRQMDEVRAQLAGVAHALDLAEASGKEKDVQIANLGNRLNAALAQRVEELQRYRSEFFGRLREVLSGKPGIAVVGDRFVFQSEVLFPVGSAELSPAGQDQVRALASTLKAIAGEIPPDVGWVLRVDGHADRQKTAGRYASNWELSAARAITVVKLLVDEGIAPNRLAATAFGDNQPLDPADTPEAYSKNRRIEIRLTDR